MRASLQFRLTLWRYLSPEPKLQDPQWVKEQGTEGYSTPSYAYARNNPIRNADPNGLDCNSSSCDRLRVKSEGAGHRPDLICNCTFIHDSRSSGQACYIDAIMQNQTESEEFRRECEPFRTGKDWGDSCHDYCDQQADKLATALETGALQSFVKKDCPVLVYKYKTAKEWNCVTP